MTGGGLQNGRLLAIALLLGVTVACDRVGQKQLEPDDGLDEAEIAEMQTDEPAEPEPVARSGDPIDDNVAYVHQLAMIGGRLTAFMELYRIGQFDAAQDHLVRADSEIYAALAPAMEARGFPGFAGQLAQLAAGAEGRNDLDEQFDIIVTELRAHGPGITVKERLLVIAELLRTASEEFGAGVSDNGAVTDNRAYRNGYSYMLAARNLLSNAETNDINAAEAIDVAHEQIDVVEIAFPALTVTETEGNREDLVSAANIVERAAQRLG